MKFFVILRVGCEKPAPPPPFIIFYHFLTHSDKIICIMHVSVDSTENEDLATGRSDRIVRKNAL